MIYNIYRLLYLNEPNIELELNNVLEECCKSFGLDATSSFRLSDFYLTYRIDDAELHLTNNESLKIAIQFHKDNKIRTVNLTLNKRFSALNNFSVTNADQEYNKGYDNNEFEDKNKQHIMKKEEKRRIFTPLNQNINKKYDTTNLKRKVSKLERSNQGIIIMIVFYFI